MKVVYYSTGSGNTRRFVERLDVDAYRIGVDAMPADETSYVLVTPTYDGKVPAPVVRFLNDPARRAGLRGVIAGGSTNFGAQFAAAGHTIARKCAVPLIHVFELTGLPEDVSTAKAAMETLWNRQSIT